MAVIKQRVCDCCKEETGHQIMLFEDRRMDPAGSMENNYNYYDIGDRCLEQALIFFFADQPKAKKHRGQVHTILTTSSQHNWQKSIAKTYSGVPIPFGIPQTCPKSLTIRIQILDKFLRGQGIKLDDSFSKFYLKKLQQYQNKKYSVPARKIAPNQRENFF
jgi:hypothetical protein